ncbi:hypothetical protein [Catenuloplanes indicus]|uniref:Uncharacterized protein n=1 Tax=Catenuloplanes indicus TaxID=137267 RepID=A0AAE3VUP1_9ACTN|nr:hypothetical protein [Catenuloplanes indicus]MDQ0364061.1 hypothetical protein [Catenuloplanes indicus]
MTYHALPGALGIQPERRAGSAGGRNAAGRWSRAGAPGGGPLLNGLAAVAGALIARMHPAHLAALLPSATVGGHGTVAAGPDADQRLPVTLGFAAIALITAADVRPAFRDLTRLRAALRRR